jgi:hypothetical protein
MLGVSDKNLIPETFRRKGVYVYNGMYYLNKYRALTAAGSNHIRWDFNDELFSHCDFSKEPKTDIYDLYAQRAWQIREKYDKVILFYSGGVDSTAMLRTFVDNDIPIDAVVIHGIFSQKSKYSEYNVAEQKRVAIPLLEKLQKVKNIKLNIHLLDNIDVFKSYASQEDWTYTGSVNLQPNTNVFKEYSTDKFIKDIMSQGSTIGLRGIDKPRLIFQDNKWYFAFLDSTGWVTSHWDHDKHSSHYLLEEFFFWSPDCLELLAKQAHIIAKELEYRFSPEQCEKKFTRDKRFKASEYNNLVEPIVYGKYITQKIGEKRPYFYLKSGPSTIYMSKNRWFFAAKEEFKKQHQLFAEGIKNIKSTIDPMHFNQAPANLNEWKNYGFVDQTLLPTAGERDPLFGTVGCWSPLYYIKDYKK